MRTAAGRNLRAARATVKVLRNEQRLSGADVAVVEMFLSLALAVDSMPTNANLWQKYREAHTELRRLARERAGSLDGLVAGLRAEVGDPETIGAKVAGARGRRRAASVGHTGYAVADHGAGHGAGAPA